MDKLTDDLETKFSQLEEKIPPLSQVQNAFWKTTPQCSVLLTQAPALKPVKINSVAKRFTPDRIFFLDLLIFQSEDPEKLAGNLTVIVKPLNRPAHVLKLSTAATSKFTYAHFRNFCEWFEIHSDSKFNKPTISKINVYGADIGQILDLSEDINSVIKIENGITKLKEATLKENNELTDKITETKSFLDNLQIEISEEQQKHFDLIAESESLSSKLASSSVKLEQTSWEVSQNEKTLTQAKNNIDQLEERAGELNKNISSLNLELQKLTTDKNLISDEYGPYVKEGRSQAAIYVLLILFPLIAIVFSVYELYAGASKLLNIEYKSSADVIASFILRIPFAAVFGLAIYYSWKLTSAIIQKIFTIHSDRLTLAKLLVLAREAVYSSAKNLDLKTETVFQEQLQLKVEILKSHLSKDLGNNFKYTPLTEMKPDKPSPTPPAVNDKNIETDEQVVK